MQVIIMGLNEHYFMAAKTELKDLSQDVIDAYLCSTRNVFDFIYSCLDQEIAD